VQIRDAKMARSFLAMSFLLMVSIYGGFDLSPKTLSYWSRVFSLKEGGEERAQL